MKVLFLNYLQYDFVNKDTGQKVDGVNCYVVPPFNVNDNTVGMEVSKYSLSVDDFIRFGIADFKLPCVADIEVFNSNTLKGKSVSRVVGFKFLREFDLLSLIDKK